MDSSEEVRDAEKEKEQKDKEKKEKKDKDAISEGSSSLYSLERPKDVMDGMGMGLGNIAKGVFGGAALMVFAPIAAATAGYNDGGGASGALKGFGVGLCTGIAGGAAMAAGGIISGGAQIGRGIYHTPGAMSKSQAGMDFDEETREWIVYDLAKEADSVLRIDNEDFLQALPDLDAYKEKKEGGIMGAVKGAAGLEDGRGGGERDVKETEMYTVLGVTPAATQGEIKKAYYKQARDHHPDRHRDDPEASAKFQKIGEAYQILSDEKLRASYDAGGKEGVGDAPKMDSAAMFAMIFGSEKFEALVGELMLASQMGMERPEEGHPKFQALKQKKREIRCAQALVAKLELYSSECDCSVTKFKDMVRADALELAASPFGGTLVREIGEAYVAHAKAALGDMFVGWEQTGKSLGTKLSIASSSVRAAFATMDMQKAQKKMEKTEAETQAGELAKAQAAAAAAAAGQGEGQPAAPTPVAAGKTAPDAAGKTAQQQVLSPEERKAADEAKLQAKMERIGVHMFKALWGITELDIQSTLEKVCQKVLKDHSVTAPVRDLRKKALLALGEVFVSCGVSVDTGLKDITERITQQMGGKAPGSSGSPRPEDEAQVQVQAQANAGQPPAQPASKPATKPAATSQEDLD
jgi:hypothetical protein